jgi:hypothetical protein
MRLTHPAAWAREAELGVVKGEVVASPLSVLLRALGGLHPRNDDGRWVGAVGRLEDQPALIGAQLDQGGTGQEGGSPGRIILRT